jgi:hypothetical protein
MVMFVGVTVTDLTGAATTIVAVPLRLPLVAVIVTVPPILVRIRPLLSIVAMEVFELDQVTGRPLKVFPWESRTVAVKSMESPTSIVVDAGATVIELMGPSAIAVKVPKTIASPVVLSTARTSTRCGVPDVGPSVQCSWAVPVAFVSATPA